MTGHSHRDHFAKHAQTVVNYVNLAAFGMVPPHRNFAESQSSPVTEKEKFDIKREPDGVRVFQDWPANIQSERFESALGVPERHPGCEPHDQIEDSTGLLASPRLPDSDQVSIERARAKGKIDISIRDRLDYFRDLAQRCGKISIEE